MPRFAANISFLFSEYDFVSRIGEAADAGFDAVECLFPYGCKITHLKAALIQAGIPLVLFNMAQGNWAAGERGIAALPGREQDFQTAANLAFDTADQIGCTRLHVLSGLVPNQQARADYLKRYRDNILSIADTAQQLGVTLTIEPINPFDIPNFLMSDFETASTLVKEINHPSVGLQFDIYHRQMMTGRVIEGLESHLTIIRHIQTASVPGRHEPFSGELDMARIFQWLDDHNYEGFIGCEYKPAFGTKEGLDWLQSYKGIS